MNDTFRSLPISDWWSRLSGDPDLSLLRRGLLRHYLRTLHRESSKALATGNKDYLKDIRVEEEALQLWWRRKLDQVEWEGLFDGITVQNSSPWDPLQIPNFSALALKPELQRGDRKWELTLFEEAYSLGWSLYQVVVEAPLGEVEAVHQRLEDAAPWDSLILCVEAATDRPLQNLWRGRWWWISRKNPTELAVQLEPQFHPLLIERVFTSSRNPTILG